MKNLNFYGDLKKDIEILEEPIILDRKKFWQKVIHCSSLLGMSLFILGIILQIEFLSMIDVIAILPSIGLLSTVEWGKILSSEPLYKKQQHAKQNITNLKLALQKENVYTTERKLANAEILEIDNSSKENVPNFSATYYAFLDKKNEIQYLRELKNVVGKQPLELFEEKDLIRLEEEQKGYQKRK